ncbi:MAG: hypothetical protein ACLR78_04010 [Roseburia sp.]
MEKLSGCKTDGSFRTTRRRSPPRRRQISEYAKSIEAQENQIKSIEAEIKRKEEEARKKAEEEKKEAAAANKVAQTYKTVSLGDISFTWPVSCQRADYFRLWRAKIPDEGRVLEPSGNRYQRADGNIDRGCCCG